MMRAIATTEIANRYRARITWRNVQVKDKSLPKQQRRVPYKIFVKDKVLVKANYEEGHHLEGYVALSDKSGYLDKTAKISKAINDPITRGELNKVVQKYDAQWCLMYDKTA